jgi:hypothetical protein
MMAFSILQLLNKSPTQWWLELKCVCTTVHIPPSDGNSYKYLPSAFKSIYFISLVATFLAKQNSCHGLWSDTHISMSQSQLTVEAPYVLLSYDYMITSCTTALFYCVTDIPNVSWSTKQHFLCAFPTKNFVFISYFDDEPGSSVSIVSDYGLDGWGSFPNRGRGFFL